MNDYVEQLSEKMGTPWSMISTCAANAQKERGEIAAALDEASLVPADSTFVAFGSMARGEVTSGSDLDWTLLVDGQVDPQHVRIVQGIDDCLVELEKKKPGSSGLFGGLAFSHELIHEIGGELDKNSNTTRRILLMLESCALGNDTGVRDRVIEHLFTRYVGEDSGYHSAKRYRPVLANNYCGLCKEAPGSRRYGVGSSKLQTPFISQVDIRVWPSDVPQLPIASVRWSRHWQV